jgi:ribosome-associated toxin RatA of RatAB toxin-antitoxin module
MASEQKVQIMNAPIEKVYQVLADYEAYPDFMDGVTKVEVLSKDGDKTKAQYSLNMIKKFTYILDLEEVENKSVSWTFDEGDIFSVNSGSWELRDLGDGTTEVTYSVEVDIKVKMLGAGMLTKQLTKIQLPAMMKSVEKRANEL